MERSSFLFSIDQARKIDKEVIFAIGLNGVEELGMKKTSLFQESYASAHYYREMLTQDQTAELDKKLRSIIKKLAEWFADRGSHKILEYLIRYFKINESHGRQIALAFLPYHDTKYYARLLQILKLDGGFWLSKFAKSGDVIPRRAVISNCDDVMLEEILSYACLSSVHLRFSTVVVYEVLTRKPKSLQRVLPFMSKWLTSKDSEQICAAFVLSTACQMTVPYINSILRDALRSPQKEVALRLFEYFIKQLGTRFELAGEIDVTLFCQVSQNSPQDFASLAQALFSHLVSSAHFDDALAMVHNYEVEDPEPFVLTILSAQSSSKGLVSVLKALHQRADIIPSICKHYSSQHATIIAKAIAGADFNTEIGVPLIVGITHADLEIRRTAVQYCIDTKFKDEDVVNRIVAVEQDPEVFLNSLRLRNIKFDTLKSRISDWSGSKKIVKACLKKLYSLGTQEQQIRLTTELHAQYPKIVQRLSGQLIDGESVSQGLVQYYAANQDQINGVIALKGFHSLIPELLQHLDMSDQLLLKLIDQIDGEDPQYARAFLPYLTKETAEVILLKVMGDDELATQILKKHMKGASLQTLISLSQSNINALKLAESFALANINTKLQLIVSVLLGFTSPIKIIREQATQLAYNLLSDEVPSKLKKVSPVQNKHSAFAAAGPEKNMLADALKLIKQCLRFRSGILMDPEYLPQILVDLYNESVRNLLLAAYSLPISIQPALIHVLAHVKDDALTLDLINNHGDFSRLNEEFAQWGNISLEKMDNADFLEHITANTYTQLSSEGKPVVIAHLLAQNYDISELDIDDEILIEYIGEGPHCVRILEYVTLKKEKKSSTLNASLMEHLDWLNQSDGPQYSKQLTLSSISPAKKDLDTIIATIPEATPTTKYMALNVLVSYGTKRGVNIEKQLKPFFEVQSEVDLEMAVRLFETHGLCLRETLESILRFEAYHLISRVATRTAQLPEVLSILHETGNLDPSILQRFQGPDVVKALTELTKAKEVTLVGELLSDQDVLFKIVEDAPSLSALLLEMLKLPELTPVLENVLDDDSIISNFSSIALGKKTTDKVLLQFLGLVKARSEKSEAYRDLIIPVCKQLEKRIKMRGKDGIKCTILYLGVLGNLLRNCEEKSVVLEKYGSMLISYATSGDSGLAKESVDCLSQFVSRGGTDFLSVLDDYCKVIISQNRDDLVAKLSTDMGEFLSPMIQEIIKYAAEHQTVTKSLGRHCPLRILLPGMSNLLDEEIDLEGLLKLAQIASEHAEDVAEHEKPFFQLFMDILDLITKEQGPNFAQSFAAFATSLSNAQLKPKFVRFLEWGMEAKDKVDNTRLVVMYCTINAMSDCLKNLFTSYHSFFWDFTMKLISEYCDSALSATPKKRSKGYSFKVVKLVMGCLQRCAIHDREQFFSDEKFEESVQTLCRLYSAVGSSHYSKLTGILMTTMTEIFGTTFDEVLWKGGIYKLLTNTRTEHETVKIACLSTLEEICGRIGSAVGCLIPDVMPFLVELFEDVSDRVTDLAVSNYRQLERLTSQELKDYLKS